MRDWCLDVGLDSVLIDVEPFELRLVEKATDASLSPSYQAQNGRGKPECCDHGARIRVAVSTTTSASVSVTVSAIPCSRLAARGTNCARSCSACESMAT